MSDDDNVLDDDEQENGVFRWMSALVVLLAVAGFFGLAWYAYKNGGEAVDEKDVELIKADTTPVKEAPANPGGMQIPNQDKTVYGLISGKTDKPVVERILPAPEEPIARTGDTETWMSDSVKNKTDGGDTSAPTTTTADASSPKEQFNPAKVRAAEAAQQQWTSEAHNVSVGTLLPTPVTATPATTAPAPTTPATPAPATPAPATPAPATVTAAPVTAAPAPVVPTPPKAAPIADTKPVPKVSETKASDDADDDEDKPDTKPTAALASEPPPAGTRIQLGSYRSQSEAESNWGKIANQFSDDLHSKQHYVVKADLGKKGVYYRLQVAPFASPRDAEQVCLDFVSAGQGCIVARGK